MRKTIYVPEKFDWDGVKDAAEKLGMSVSQYLLGRDHKVDAPTMIEMSLDRIELKLGGIEEHLKQVAWRLMPAFVGLQEGPPVPEPDDSAEDDVAIIAEGQARLDAERAKRKIKKDKIAKVRESPVFFNPQPKGKE